MTGPWYIYILQCADGTLYTGITTDPERRLREHNAGGALAARYTRARLPVTLRYAERAADRAEAARREAAIKKLPRAAKTQLLCDRALSRLDENLLSKREAEEKSAETCVKVF